MSTLGDFRLNVQYILGLDTGADQTQIDFYANEAIRKILLDTHCYVTSDTVTPGATADYTLATTALAILQAYFTSSGTDYKLERRSVGDIIDMRMNASGATGPARFYALAGHDTLMWHPTPAAADKLTYYYVPYPAAAMSAAGHDPSSVTYGAIPAEQHDVIVYYVCWRMADATDDASSAQGVRYQQLYQQALGKMKRDLSRRGGNRLADIQLPPRRRGMVPPHFPSQMGV